MITLTVDGVNYFVQNGPLRHVPQPYNFYIFLVWFYFHFMQFFSVPIQFIYRYLILCRDTKISNRKYFCFFIPPMIVVFFQTVFFGLIYKHEEIHDLNATRDIGRWLLESGESTVHLTCVGPPGDIGVLMGNVETICFIGLNYIIIGLCAFRIHVHLQRSKGHFSTRTAAMHKSFTRLLFIQGVLPIVSSIGPTLLICYVYVFRLSLINFAFFLDFCNAWLPTVGASFVLFIFKPFRNQILRGKFLSTLMNTTTNSNHSNPAVAVTPNT
ncbi:hypothetical protein FO519_010204 [Halicephalobus sp. NKZ332]|nr:hypothetical protein FO519_010204 [Halicephalobus sp. NKZ332]